MKIKKEIFFSILLINIFILVSSINFVSAVDSANATMTVEVDLVGFNETLTPDVSIEVPEHVFLGNLTKSGLVSDEVKVEINNTGKVNITITPQLKDSSEKILSYLFFRTRKSSSNTELNKFYKIGDYNLDIEKPSSGGKRSEYCYMRLDLKDYSESINQDMIGYKSDVIFIAMAK